MTTYKFRIKDNNTIKHLKKFASAVNFVWNYCNETSYNYIRNKSKFLSGFDLNNLTKGCSKELGISAITIQAVCEEYAVRRKKTNKNKLAWRNRKRSLGWIPTKSNGFALKEDTIKYAGHIFRFWKSREVLGTIKTANFSEDARGRWYVNIVCRIDKYHLEKTGNEIGIDLGLKTIATLSNGERLQRDNITAKYADKLATAQRAVKKKQAANIHAKIKNTRKDWNHKTTTDLVNRFDRIIVGNVSPSKLKRTKFAKSVSDAGWADFKSMLAYKAIALGVGYKEVKENFSTVTCSVCFKRTGPSGLGTLGVREWTCKCGATHDRDVNAAKNILRFGHESLKGILLL